MYPHGQVKLVSTTDYAKIDFSLCKFDVKVKNRTAVAGSVGLFKFEWILFKGESAT